MQYTSTKWRYRWIKLCAGLLALPGMALAFDGDQSEVPNQVDVYDNGLIGFRVYLPITTGMCAGSTDNWAYIIGPTPGSSTAFGDPNYNTFVATILMAKSQALTLRVLTVADGAAHCHIQYVSVD